MKSTDNTHKSAKTLDKTSSIYVDENLYKSDQYK